MSYNSPATITTTTAISGNAKKNRGGTVFGAGNAVTTGPKSNITNTAMKPSTSAVHHVGRTYVVEAVSPASSGNLGTLKPYSAGRFGDMEKGYYITRGYMSRLAAAASTVLKCPGSETKNRRFANYARGNNRYNITDFSTITGLATKGGNAGDAFAYIDPIGGGAVTQEQYPTDAVPGEFCYLVTGKNPTQANYPAKTAH